MKKIFILIAISLIIFSLKDSGIILLNENINNFIISLTALYGAICYKDEFKDKATWIFSLLLISIFTLFIGLMILTYLHTPAIINIGIGFIISAGIMLYLIEGNIFTDIRRMTIITLGYFLTMISTGHFLLAINLNGGFYPSVKEKVYSKCIDGACIDIHKTKWKVNYYTIYHYNKNFNSIKYLTKNPEITWTYQENIDPKFCFKKENNSYILEYTNSKLENKRLIIK